MKDINVANIRLLRIDLAVLESVTSLGDVVLAQNAAILEISKMLNRRFGTESDNPEFEKISEAMDAVKSASQTYVRSTKFAIELAKSSADAGESDA